MAIRVYKGEGRILVIPMLRHIAGFSVEAFEFFCADENECNIRKLILNAVDFIKKSPLSSSTPKERDINAVWRKNTKYKSELSFWKNNHFAEVIINEDESYKIFSKARSEKHNYSYHGTIKKIELPKNATADEVGAAILDVLEASEEYYANYKVPKQIVGKEIELMDQTKLSIRVPSQSEWTDCGDSGSAEIYQCYRYIT
ncbi:MAG: hypothetical protein K6G88_11345, partial [Lachnospiraceae bacterium]|nr:hypothetical protein [Lachnospiraceae bacterium]